MLSWSQLMRQSTERKYNDSGTGINLFLNDEQDRKVVVYFRRSHHDHSPLSINSSLVKNIQRTKFVEVDITENLIYSLWKLRRLNLPQAILTTSYRGTRAASLSGIRIAQCLTANPCSG